MRPFSELAIALTFLAAMLASPARAQDAIVLAATYIEVMPSSAAAGATLLKRYRDASRKQDGNSRFDALQEIGRPNRFVVIESWKDAAAFAAHGKAAGTPQFRDQLKPIEDAPYDERLGNELYFARGKTAAQPAVYVVTHVDVIPSGKDDCMAALKAMSVDTAADPGNISYSVLQQSNRGNHFTVIEAWSSKASFDAHAMAAHTRSFREKLTPLAGALYDERLYKALD
jgi:quinol monooxygenase YgiN